MMNIVPFITTYSALIDQLNISDHKTGQKESGKRRKMVDAEFLIPLETYV